MSTETKNETTVVKFYERDVKGEQIATGVLRRATRKNSKSFLVKCSVTGKWCYCSRERHEKLIQRFGSEEELGRSYISREGKAKIKADAEQVAATTEE